MAVNALSLRHFFRFPRHYKTAQPMVTTMPLFFRIINRLWRSLFEASFLAQTYLLIKSDFSLPISQSKEIQLHSIGEVSSLLRQHQAIADDGKQAALHVFFHGLFVHGFEAFPGR